MTTPTRRRSREPSTAAGRRTRESIRTEAIRLFREKGFESTTMRELATTVGIEAASLYNHFPSKHDLLADILIESMAGTVAAVRDAVRAAGDEPADQLRAGLTAWVLVHADDQGQAFLADAERRSLRPDDAAYVLAQRRELFEILHEVVRHGCERGAFAAEDVRLSTVLVMSMCARLAVWYRPDGRLSLPRIAELISASALRMLAAPPATAG